MAKIRVLHLHGGRFMCGVATHVLTLLDHLDTKHFEGHLVLLQGGQVEAAAKTMGLTPFIIGKTFPGDPVCIRRLYNYYRENEIQIVHTHTLNGNFYGRLAALLPQRPLIVTTVHTYMDKTVVDFLKGPFKRRLILRQNRFVDRWSSLLITPSKGVKRSLVAQGIPPDKIHVVPNGIRLPRKEGGCGGDPLQKSQWNIPSQKPVVGVVARLVPQKNIGALIELAGQLSREGCSFSLVIIGDGPERKRLEELSRKYGLSRQTVFTGWQQNVQRLLSMIDLFVLPSLEENFPFSVIEAMAALKPVVAFDSGSLSEVIVNGETGFLIPHGDSKAMKEAVKGLLSHPERARLLGFAGRKRVERYFSAGKMTMHMEGVYRDLVNSMQGK